MTIRELKRLLETVAPEDEELVVCVNSVHYGYCVLPKAHVIDDPLSPPGRQRIFAFELHYFWATGSSPVYSR